jgi:hypothetical protein
LDKYPHHAQLDPRWEEFDPDNPPARFKNRKMQFKTDWGPACIGVWYPGSEWRWAAPMAKHTEEQKAIIKARGSSAGRFSDGKPHELD